MEVQCITFDCKVSTSLIPGRTRQPCHTELTLYVDVGETIYAEVEPQEIEEVALIRNAIIKKTSSTYYAGGQFGSLLTFAATAMRERVGPLSDPKIRFSCEGRFDPAGAGDCQYSFFLNVDKNGKVSFTAPKITAGEGKISIKGGAIWVEITG